MTSDTGPRLGRTLTRILCGDFNSPQAETPDGQAITWGQKVVGGHATYWKKRSGKGTGEVWDKAERDVIVGLASFDLPDVHRMIHGYGREDFSWYLRRKEHLTGRRFDHVFASRKLNPIDCRYLHSFRENGLSDHSPLEVDFQSPTT